MNNTRKELLDRLTKILEERADSHGDALFNLESTSKAWEWWLKSRGSLRSDKNISAEDVAVMMFLMKVSRMLGVVGMLNTDNWLDAAGYAICGAEVIERTTPKPNETTKA